MNEEFDLSKSFELVLTDLDNRIEPFLKNRPTTPEGIQEKVSLVYLRVALRAMIPCYFNSLRSQSAELYKSFASNALSPGDAVITFNYDLALDRELKRSGMWSIGSGYGFAVGGVDSENSPCKLFKLHGSTNWRGELFQGNLGFSQLGPGEMSLGQRPVIGASEFEYLGYADSSDPQDHKSRVSVECLIMPTARKQFFNQTSLGREWEGFWDSLWSQAGEALANSSEVHVIGYSIPEYDARARDLLATRIGESALIEVCCHSGTSAVVESLKRLGHLHVEPACSTAFEGWVSSTETHGTRGPGVDLRQRDEVRHLRDC